MSELGDQVMVLEGLDELGFTFPNTGQIFNRIHTGYMIESFDPVTAGLGAVFYASLLTAGVNQRLRGPALATALVSGLSSWTRAVFFLEDPDGA